MQYGLNNYVLWLLHAQLILWGGLHRIQLELRVLSYDVSYNEQKGEIWVILVGRFGLQDAAMGYQTPLVLTSHRMISLHCQD